MQKYAADKDFMNEIKMYGLDRYYNIQQRLFRASVHQEFA